MCPNTSLTLQPWQGCPKEPAVKIFLITYKLVKCHAISCSLGTFNKSSVDTLLKIHTLRDIAKNVKKEKMWLKKAVKVPSEHCLPPNGLIDEYKKLIFQNSDGTVVLNKTILPSDLATLTGRTWLGLAVIQGVLNIINSQSSDTRAFILNNLIGLTGSQLQKLVETKSGKIIFFTFIVNVGGEINERFAATPSNPGRHWTLLYIDSVDNKWFYCDTLGWAPVLKN